MRVQIFGRSSILTKLKITTSVALLFLVWVAGAGQTTDKSKTRPDLSGVWAFDNSKSKIDLKGKEQFADYVLTIVHHEPEIRITRTYKEDGRERSEESIYYTDGRPEVTPRGKDSEPTTRWQGNKLVRRSVRMSTRAFQNIPTEVVNTETWQLSADGKTLTRTMTISGMVSFNNKYVYNRIS